MRVLTVINWLNRGGVEVQLLQALPVLQQTGVEMDICCLDRGILDADFLAQGCRIWQIRKTPNCHATAKQLQHILAKNRYDVVHCHLGYTSGGFVLGAARADVPIAVSFHSPEECAAYRWRSPSVLKPIRRILLDWHHRLIERHAQILVGHSEANLSGFNRRWRDDPVRYRVVFNGVAFPAEVPSRDAVRQSLGLDHNALVLLHVGSLREHKNHAGLLQVLKHVVRRRAKVLLMLVGGGSLRGEIETDAHRLGLEKRIRFAGMQPDVWPYYAAADVFVFCSTFEGFGNVLVEAQAAGLPIVASDIPGHRESVAPVQHPFLFPLPDYERAAELVLQQASAAESGPRPWVTAAEAYVRKHFSIERFAADLRQLYLDLVAGQEHKWGGEPPKAAALCQTASPKRAAGRKRLSGLSQP